MTKQDSLILRRQAQQDSLNKAAIIGQNPSGDRGQKPVRSEPANEDLNQPVRQDLSSASPPDINEPEQDSPLPPKKASKDPPDLPRQALQSDDSHEHDPGNQPDNQAPDEQSPERPSPEQQLAERPQPGQPSIPKHKAPLCSWRIILIGLLSVLFVVIAAFIGNKYPHPLTAILSTKVSLPKPTITMNTKTHVPPSAPSLQLVAKCEAYNILYTIHHCRWKQIHPLATTSENTVLPGGLQDCPPTNPTAREVDATLHGLKVPTELGTYTFELACGHEADNSAIKRVEIWVNELNPPIMTVANPKLIVSTSTGFAKMEASCRAVQGRIVERKWEYFDGPLEAVLITPTDDGVVQLTSPGVYKFKYRCTDSFGGTASR